MAQLGEVETLIVDNYDSFTHNLAALVTQLTGRPPVIVQNDHPIEAIELSRFGRVIISPGPGSPREPGDVGISWELVARAQVPLLGVCLGHQLVATYFGGSVGRAREARHGRISAVRHRGDALFAGVPRRFDAVRYHSLTVTRLPATLRAIAEADDGAIMALRHVERPMWGVQFHPESILSEHGAHILANFLAERPGSMAGPGWSRPRRAGKEPNGRGDRWRKGAGRRPMADAGWRLEVRRLDVAVSPEAVYEALYHEDSASFWLDSSPHDPRSKMSIMGSCDGELSHVLTYRAGESQVVREFADGRREHVAGDIVDVIERELARFSTTDVTAAPVRFCLGYVGYFGYGMGLETCGASGPPPPMPDARVMFVERAVAFDHKSGVCFLLALRELRPGSPLEAAATAWMEETERRIRALAAAPGADQPLAPLEQPAPLPSTSQIEAEFDFRHGRRAYVEKVRACQELIRAGESYELCLTNTATMTGHLAPLETYLQLRRRAQVPYGALLRCGPYSVLSASPECFLAIGPGGQVETRPIKGTAPRGRTPEEDKRLGDALRSSAKDRAENLMIVDLMRNDLNAVCEAGSVHVPSLFRVESFPSVHQLISTVRGTLRPDCSALDCVRAAFPPGSMTGAPKRRSVQLLDQIEEGPRGVYSGALGWMSLDGALELSVVIRSIVIGPDGATFGVGGAITQLSRPDDEYEETLIKAQVLAAVLTSE